jgi:hypothetical protein
VSYGKRWKLLAEVRIPNVDNERDSQKWRRVCLGPQRVIRCECGHVYDRRKKNDLDFSCDHIQSLYMRRCTENPDDKKLSWMTYGFGRDRKPAVWLVRLTQLGRETFYPLWTAEILSSQA